jgi:hypothetical protein
MRNSMVSSSPPLPYTPFLVVFISMWKAKIHININYEAILIILYINKDEEENVKRERKEIT